MDTHISHAELKAELLSALRPIWKRKYPGPINLCLEHLTLRWETGARLEVMKNTGRDFIMVHFMGNKGARGAKKSQVLMVHVEVDRAIVFAAEEQLEEQDLDAQQYLGFGERTKVRQI